MGSTKRTFYFNKDNKTNGFFIVIPRLSSSPRFEKICFWFWDYKKKWILLQSELQTQITDVNTEKSSDVAAIFLKKTVALFLAILTDQNREVEATKSMGEETCKTNNSFRWCDIKLHIFIGTKQNHHH